MAFKKRKNDHIPIEEARRRKAKKTTPSPADRVSPQTHPVAETTLDRLAQFRLDLDSWHAGGRLSQFPQPADHGLRLPVLSPAEIVWRST